MQTYLSTCIMLNSCSTNLFSLMSSSLTLDDVSLTCLDEAIVSFRVWLGLVMAGLGLELDV